MAVYLPQKMFQRVEFLFDLRNKDIDFAENDKKKTEERRSFD